MDNILITHTAVITADLYNHVLRDAAIIVCEFGSPLVERAPVAVVDSSAGMIDL